MTRVEPTNAQAPACPRSVLASLATACLLAGGHAGCAPAPCLHDDGCILDVTSDTANSPTDDVASDAVGPDDAMNASDQTHVTEEGNSNGGTACSGGCSATQDRLVQAGDVAVLIPPVSPSSPGVLSLDDAGTHGALLPAALYDEIDVFVAPAPGTSNRIERSAFQVVAVRIDPCFPDISAWETDPARCRPQLRLVAQPVLLGFPPPLEPSPTAEQSFGATDNAIHLLYDLPSDDFADLVTDLLAWSSLEQSLNVAGTGAHVWVHPRLSLEDAAAEARIALRSLVLRYAGVDRLTQYTFMRGEGVHAWDFGGFAVENGQPVAVTVHGTEGTVQRLETSANVVSVAPATAHSVALSALFGKRSSVGAPLTLGSVDDQRASMQAALDIENPTKSHPESVDCVSCHSAYPLRQRAELFGATTTGLSAYTSSYPLGGAVSSSERLFNTGRDCEGSAGDGCLFVENRLRAFGWLGQDPVVSQRTVNEAVAVADALSRMLNP